MTYALLAKVNNSKTKAKQLPSIDFLRECFEIDTSAPSGLRWKFRPIHHFSTTKNQNIFNAKFAGRAAGYLKKGYWGVQIGTAKFLVHRIVFFISNGFEPCQVDHKDVDGYNNSVMNLRAATHTQNVRNTGIKKTNSSGYKGVTWHKTRKLWHAMIWRDRKRAHLGYFNTPEEASVAYLRAATELHGEFFRSSK
jgi:hypothetical protein